MPSVRDRMRAKLDAARPAPEDLFYACIVVPRERIPPAYDPAVDPPEDALDRKGNYQAFRTLADAEAWCLKQRARRGPFNQAEIQTLDSIDAEGVSAKHLVTDMLHREADMAAKEELAIRKARREAKAAAKGQLS